MIDATQVKRKMTECIVRAGFDGCSEGDLYVVCDMNMPLWQIVRTMLVESDFMKMKGHWCELTQSAQTMLSESLAATK